MDKLGINMIPAGSPQAKGRVERLWGTLQDRLVQEFDINRIKDIDSANEFMKKYIPKFNARFSVAAKGGPVFRELASGIDIDHILCRKYIRKLDKAIEKPVKSFVKIDKKRTNAVKPAANHPWRSDGLNGFKYDPRDSGLYEGLYNSTVAWETDNY